MLVQNYLIERRALMQRLLDPRRDIAGIITNRWGHARMVQPPGWYYGANGRPPAREVVQAGYGRVTIAHSELNGHMNVTGAIAQGKRAGERCVAAVAVVLVAVPAAQEARGVARQRRLHVEQMHFHCRVLHERIHDVPHGMQGIA